MRIVSSLVSAQYGAYALEGDDREATRYEHEWYQIWTSLQRLSQTTYSSPPRLILVNSLYVKPQSLFLGDEAYVVYDRRLVAQVQRLNLIRLNPGSSYAFFACHDRLLAERLVRAGKLTAAAALLASADIYEGAVDESGLPESSDHIVGSQQQLQATEVFAMAHEACHVLYRQDEGFRAVGCELAEATLDHWLEPHRLILGHALGVLGTLAGATSARAVSAMRRASSLATRIVTHPRLAAIKVASRVEYQIARRTPTALVDTQEAIVEEVVCDLFGLLVAVERMRASGVEYFDAITGSLNGLAALRILPIYDLMVEFATAAELDASVAHVVTEANTRLRLLRRVVELEPLRDPLASAVEGVFEYHDDDDLSYLIEHVLLGWSRTVTTGLWEHYSVETAAAVIALNLHRTPGYVEQLLRDPHQIYVNLGMMLGEKVHVEDFIDSLSGGAGGQPPPPDADTMRRCLESSDWPPLRPLADASNSGGSARTTNV